MIRKVINKYKIISVENKSDCELIFHVLHTNEYNFFVERSIQKVGNKGGKIDLRSD